VTPTNFFEFELLPAQVASKYLMIVLHGKGDSLKPFIDFDKELGIANMNFMLLNAPNKYLTGRSWYGDPPFQSSGVLKIRKKMFRLLDEQIALGWDPKKIFLLGFSQGCLVSTDVALHYPRRLGGLIGVSGYFHFDPRWKKQISKMATETPWLITHGTRDDVLSFEDTLFGVEKLKSVGIKIDWVETNKKHTFDEDQYPLIRKWVRRQMFKH
jgi:phospholipase/carboxylesterase